MAACPRVSRDGTTTRVTLARPDRANALDAESADALLESMLRAEDDGTRLLVLEGEGRNFCGGFDFTGFEEQSEGDLLLRFVRIEMLLQALWHAPFQTMALAHGGCYGTGADLVAACSLRIADPDAKFRMPGLRFGLVLGTRRLARRVGGDAARSLLMTTRAFDAQEALATGFATRIAPRADWDALVAAASRDAATLPADGAARLCRITAPDTRAEDMAELVASAARPGLKERIRRFRAGA